MLLGSPAPHLSPSVINRTMCLGLHVWLLRKQDCCPDNMARLNIRTTQGCSKCRSKRGVIITHSSRIIMRYIDKYVAVIIPTETFSFSGFFTWEVVVDLVHLQDDIIGNTSLSQEDVQLARHTTCHWVDSKPGGDGCKILKPINSETHYSLISGVESTNAPVSV